MGDLTRAGSATPPVEWGSAGRAIPGEDVSGDAGLVRVGADVVLIAAIDGSGHGEEAASAARTAIAALERRSEEPVAELFELCHDELRATRGAAMSVASFRPRAATVSWAGVGNVEGVLLRASEGLGPRKEVLLLRNGVVGYEFSPPRVSSIQVRPGDTLLFVTDGVRQGFLEGIDAAGRPQEIADAVLSRHAKGTDDALVLVVRFAGGEGR